MPREFQTLRKLILNIKTSSSKWRWRQSRAHTILHKLVGRRYIELSSKNTLIINSNRNVMRPVSIFPLRSGRYVYHPIVYTSYGVIIELNLHELEFASAYKLASILNLDQRERFWVSRIPIDNDGLSDRDLFRNDELIEKYQAIELHQDAII